MTTKRIPVTIYTNGGRALRFETNALTLFNASGSDDNALPRLDTVSGITVNAPSILLDTTDEESVDAFVVT